MLIAFRLCRLGAEGEAADACRHGAWSTACMLGHSSLVADIICCMLTGAAAWKAILAVPANRRFMLNAVKRFC